MSILDLTAPSTALQQASGWGPVHSLRVLGSPPRPTMAAAIMRAFLTQAAKDQCSNADLEVASIEHAQANLQAMDLTVTDSNQQQCQLVIVHSSLAGYLMDCPVADQTPVPRAIARLLPGPRAWLPGFEAAQNLVNLAALPSYPTGAQLQADADLIRRQSQETSGTAASERIKSESGTGRPSTLTVPSVTLPTMGPNSPMPTPQLFPGPQGSNLVANTVAQVSPNAPAEMQQAMVAAATAAVTSLWQTLQPSLTNGLASPNANGEQGGAAGTPVTPIDPNTPPTTIDPGTGNVSLAGSQRKGSIGISPMAYPTCAPDSNGIYSRGRPGLRTMRAQRFTGVYRQSGRFRAQFSHGGLVHQLGMYDTEDAAAQAWDRVAWVYRGRQADLNFPDLIHVYDTEESKSQVHEMMDERMAMKKPRGKAAQAAAAHAHTYNNSGIGEPQHPKPTGRAGVARKPPNQSIPPVYEPPPVYEQRKLKKERQEDGAENHDSGSPALLPMPQGSGYPKDPSQGGMMLGPGGVMGAADHMGYAMGMQGHYTMAYPGMMASMHPGDMMASGPMEMTSPARQGGMGLAPFAHMQGGMMHPQYANMMAPGAMYGTVIPPGAQPAAMGAAGKGGRAGGGLGGSAPGSARTARGSGGGAGTGAAAPMEEEHDTEERELTPPLATQGGGAIIAMRQHNGGDAVLTLAAAAAAAQGPTTPAVGRGAVVPDPAGFPRSRGCTGRRTSRSSASDQHLQRMAALVYAAQAESGTGSGHDADNNNGVDSQRHNSMSQLNPRAVRTSNTHKRTSAPGAGVPVLNLAEGGAGAESAAGVQMYNGGAGGASSPLFTPMAGGMFSSPQGIMMMGPGGMHAAGGGYGMSSPMTMGSPATMMAMSPGTYQMMPANAAAAARGAQGFAPYGQVAMMGPAGAHSPAGAAAAAPYGYAAYGYAPAGAGMPMSPLKPRGGAGGPAGRAAPSGGVRARGGYHNVGGNAGNVNNAVNDNNAYDGTDDSQAEETEEALDASPDRKRSGGGRYNTPQKVQRLN